MSLVRERCLQFLVAFCAFTACAPLAAEQAQPAFSEHAKTSAAPRAEFYAGGTATDPGFSLSSTVIWALGRPIAEPGWRLRIGGSYSEHESRFTAGPTNAPVVKRERKKGLDLAAGYQANYRFLWLKVYAGAVYREDIETLNGAPSQASRSEISGLAAVETWWRLGDRAWATLDFGWNGIDNGASVFSRAGYTLRSSPSRPELAAGLEAGAYADEHSPVSRKAGPFIQARWNRHEVTLSGGASQDGETDDWEPYATLSYGQKF